MTGSGYLFGVQSDLRCVWVLAPVVGAGLRRAEGEGRGGRGGPPHVGGAELLRAAAASAEWVGLVDLCSGWVLARVVGAGLHRVEEQGRGGEEPPPHWPDGAARYIGGPSQQKSTGPRASDLHQWRYSYLK